jgi:hypothetical protein
MLDVHALNKISRTQLASDRQKATQIQYRAYVRDKYRSNPYRVGAIDSALPSLPPCHYGSDTDSEDDADSVGSADGEHTGVAFVQDP